MLGMVHPIQVTYCQGVTFGTGKITGYALSYTPVPLGGHASALVQHGGKGMLTAGTWKVTLPCLSSYVMNTLALTLARS